MRIDTSGSVGIGTSSPASYGLLAAKADQTADTAITVSNGGTANASTTMSFMLSEGGSKQGWFRRYRDGTGAVEVGFTDALLFTGNIGKEPEIKTLQSGKKVATFNVAVNDGYYGNEGWVDRTYWIRVVAWEKTAERIEEKATKGTSVFVEGKITVRNYTDKNGIERTATEVVAHSVQIEKPKEAVLPQSEMAATGDTQQESDLPF